MSVQSTTVEIGFDLGLGGTFFILDSPVQGVLDNPLYTLGGLVFVDVTSFVRSVSVRRGKSRQLDKFTAGTASIQFNNNLRTFDPKNTASPFFSQIVPKRLIRIRTGGTDVFNGLVDDWNLSYDLSGLSIVTADCSDGFSLLTQRKLETHTATVQTTGARINAVLDRTDVDWPIALRDVDTGSQTLQADLVEDGTNALEYLQRVNDSEPGSIFIGADGLFYFRDRLVAPSSTSLVTFADNGSGIGFSDVDVVYGSELLFNDIQIERATGGTAIAQDNDSIQNFGQQAYLQSGLLMNTDDDALGLANYLLAQYKEPEYRFETLSVQLERLSNLDENKVLGLEIGDVCEIKFTPNQVGSQIQQYTTVIKVEHDIRPQQHRITFGFQTLDYASLVLDDPVFGLLNTGHLGL